MDGLSKKIKMAKEQVRKLECRSIQISQSEEEQQDFRETELWEYIKKAQDYSHPRKIQRKKLQTID